MSGDPLDGGTQAFVERDAGFPSDHAFGFFVRRPQLHHFTFAGSHTLRVCNDLGSLADDLENLFSEVANADGVIVAKVDLFTQHAFSFGNFHKTVGGIFGKGEIARRLEAAEFDFVASQCLHNDRWNNRAHRLPRTERIERT